MNVTTATYFVKVIVGFACDIFKVWSCKQDIKCNYFLSPLLKHSMLSLFVIQIEINLKQEFLAKDYSFIRGKKS